LTAVRVGAIGLVAATVAVVAATRGDERPSPADPARPGAPAVREAAELPLRKQVGQLLVLAFDGTRVPAYFKLRLRQGTLAGAILFSDNVTTPRGLRRLNRTLQRASGRGALVMVDQEGGLARRIPFAAPSPAQSAITNAARARRVARAGAADLSRLGVNVNLSPVADLDDGPVLRQRAYPGQPASVGRQVVAAVRGYRHGGVAATAKHFPGLGGAAANTDDAPATIRRSRGQLFREDLAPFRAAIDVRVPLVMAAHALYPALDARRIASQSPPILRSLLRRRLGFDGVVITDSIEARAVLRRSSVQAAAVRSIAAGADQVLMSGSASWKLVFPRLMAEARRSPAFRNRVRDSAARVIELKRSLGLRPPRP
jgi:beta-N-acetylhexosaminidase